MKRREIAWMLLPCLLLAGVGWYFTKRNARTTGEFRVVVDKTSIEPITPREAADDFDTKVVIQAHSEGAPQVPTNHKYVGGSVAFKGMRLFSVRDGKEMP